MLGIFITAGYPNYQKTLRALKILHELDVDLIELGIPFSDPLADGPVIQKASHEALEQGMNLDKVFALVQESGLKFKNLILFSYYNPLFAYGIDRLLEACKRYGVKGVLVPDLQVDEAEELSKKFSVNNLDLILLASITSTDQRLKKISELSNPWIYLVSRVGITGSNKDISDLKQVSAVNEEDMLTNTLASLKKYSSKKIAIGFGIDSATRVREVLDGGADIAIVGSKAIKVMEEDRSEDLSEFRKFVQELKVASMSSSRGTQRVTS